MELRLDTPVGPMMLREREGTIIALEFLRTRSGGKTARTQTRGNSALLREAADQLMAYFAGRLREFDLPLGPEGTDFQTRVWRVMRDIPYGKTLSYGEVAKRLKTGPRAVGGACGQNPLAIFVPCHRVLAANGALGGYSGMQGLDTKRFLLRLEGVLPA